MSGLGRGLTAVRPAWMSAGQPGVAPAAAPGSAQAPPTFPGPPGANMNSLPPPPGAPQSYYGQPPMGAQPGPGMGQALPGPPLMRPQQPGAPQHLQPGMSMAAPGSSPGMVPMAQPGTSAGAGATAPASGTATSAAKPKWSEHKSPAGRLYWYNRETGKSTWERPADLQGPSQAKPSTPVPSTPTPGTPAAAAAAAAPAAASGWKEFTAPDGRKYYHNKATGESKWTLPDDLKAAAAAAAARASAAGGAAANAQPPSIQVVKLEHAQPQSNGMAAGGAGAAHAARVSAATTVKPFMYASKEEAKDAFKELLAYAGVSSDSTWEPVMKKIVGDPRYSALHSLGERKACFKEYQEMRVKAEKEEARAALRKAREEFVVMLEECKELKADMRYSKVAQLLDWDPRWQAVTKEEARSELLKDYQKDKDKKDRDARKAEQKKRQGAFRKLLEASTFIKPSSSWRKVQGKLEGEEAYEMCDKMDRLDVFGDYIRDLDKKEKEKLEKEKEEKRRKERRNRDAFKALLQQHRKEGRLHAKLRWKEYVEGIKKEPAYVAVEKNVGGSRPKELYEDVIEEVEAEFTRDRSAIKDGLKNAGLDVSAQWALADFETALETAGVDIANVPDANRRLIFEELQGKAAEKAVKEEKKRTAAREDFSSLIRHTKGIDADSTWEQAEPLLRKEPEYKQVDESERQAAFDAAIEKLIQRRDKELEQARLEKEKDDDRKKDKKRHKKERHSDKDHKSSKRHHSEDEERRSKRHKKEHRDKHHRSDKTSSRGEREPSAAAATQETSQPPEAGESPHAAAPGESEGDRRYETVEEPAGKEVEMGSPASEPHSKEAREEGEL
ncbi:hypothetical protein WJX73_010842 [Symbiochloris irregularis]|uniref:Uncharacterized protein n=1 Tax=Symbiochloris irregularis TaxID=706552 RepID=A0AAW1NV27_9CHLO